MSLARLFRVGTWLLLLPLSLFLTPEKASAQRLGPRVPLGPVRASYYAPDRLYRLSFSPASPFDGTTWTRDRLYFGDVFEPWPFIPGDIWGWPYDQRIENPIGHTLEPRGDNGYVYRPLYAGPTAPGATPALVDPGATPVPAANGLAANPVAANALAANAGALDPAQRYIAAGTAFQTGNYRLTLELLQNIGPQDANAARADLLRAQASLSLGDYPAAEAALRQALPRLDPAQWSQLADRANQLYGTPGQYLQLVQTLERAVRSRPEAQERKLLLAFHYGMLGYRDAAVKKLNQLLAVDPRDAVALQVRDHFNQPAPAAAPAGPREF